MNNEIIDHDRWSRMCWAVGHVANVRDHKFELVIQHVIVSHKEISHIHMT